MDDPDTAVEPPYPGEMGPQSIKISVLRAVSSHIKWYYQRQNDEPIVSDEDDDFWYLGVPEEDLPTIYKLPKSYAVYTLRCEQPTTQAAQQRAKDEALDFSNGFFDAYALNHAPITYVGYTKNPYRRLNEHFDPLTEGSKFTEVFPPIRVMSIEWCDTEQEAKNRELDVGAKLLRKQGVFLNPSVRKGVLERSE